MGWWACSETQIRIWFPLVSLDKSKAWWHSTILHCGYLTLESFQVSSQQAEDRPCHTWSTSGSWHKIPSETYIALFWLGRSWWSQDNLYNIFQNMVINLVTLSPKLGLAHCSQHNFNMWQILPLLVCHWFLFSSRMCSLNNFPFCNLFL